MARFLSVLPSVPVRALDPALAFYCDKLGFQIRHRAGDGGAILCRESVELHLTTLDDERWKRRSDFSSKPIESGAESFIPGTAAYRIEVDDVRSLYDEVRAKVAIHPRGALTQQPWGDLDFATGDPDGNLLSFFQRPSS